MDWEEKSLRLGGIVIAGAILLRLFTGGGFGIATRALTSQEFTAAVVFLETGRVIKPKEPATTVPEETESPPATVAETEGPPPTVAETTPPDEKEAPAQAVFGAGDASLVKVNSVCGYDADLPALLQAPLSWNLTEEGPKVLILHTHGSESYKKTEDYKESSAYRTKNKDYNVVSIGERIKEVLESGGIGVVHDKTLHDVPSYNAAYANSRESMEKYLKKYPTISLVLDIHRDSVEDENGKEMKFSIKAGGESVAKLMLVVGTDAGGLAHPNWPDNMSLAVKLHAQLEKNTPGICRAISFRNQRFNQDLSPGALIVEVGSAGNTRQEALAAAELLGRGILDIAGGTS